MSYEVTALPFQAYANYETWSIDFGSNSKYPTPVTYNLMLKLLASPNYIYIILKTDKRYKIKPFDQLLIFKKNTI